MSDEHATAGDTALGHAKDASVFNRQELTAQVAEKTGLPKPKAGEAVQAVFECTSDALKSGKVVRLAGFGAFQVSERKAGKGRDPRSGAEIDVPESKSVRFRPGKVLRDMVADTEV